MSRLSILIVSFNARQDLGRCLESLISAPPVIPHEVVVIDNASPEGSPADVVARFPSVRLIALEANIGFARANNVGFRATTGELVLLLNSDTVVPAGAIDRLVEALDRVPDAAAAGPRLVDGDGRAELSFGPMVAPWTEPAQRRLVRALEAGDPRARAAVEQRTRLSGRPDWVSGACLLVRRADADVVGLLDERYFMYLEDVDFCAALRARGRAILFVPEVTVTHLCGRSRRTASAATQAAYRRSHLAFYYLGLKGESPRAT
jgi:GT2 family glycosyltransferase